MLLALWSSGMRKAEICSLDRSDVRDGAVFFDGCTLGVIREYLAARADSYAPLFVRRNRAKREPSPSGEGYRLSAQSACLRVRKYAEAVGVEASPHHLRHALACRMLNNGARMCDIQAVLGHQSIAVTSKIYARYDVRSLREAYNRSAGAVE